VPATDHDEGTLPTPVDNNTVPPLMSHIARLPALSCQRISPLPSPLKSPVATTEQFVGMLPSGAVEVTAAPLRNQMAVLPVLSRQSRSKWLFTVGDRCESPAGHPVARRDPTGNRIFQDPKVRVSTGLQPRHTRTLCFVALTTFLRLGQPHLSSCE
jgi:hypothetical protein